ncbi:MAG: 3-isopropylmalate dehydrogenase [Chloroflexi bacterium]|nr:3-isopropylmalate dehydrogenase [Chloroflexota bacterium]
MNAHIITLPGDGIGPEVTREGVRVLEHIAKRFGHSFEFEEHLIGGCAIDATGEALTSATLDACKRADAVLLGAVGGPKWDDPHAKTRPEAGLLGLRKGLGLFANLRPVKPHPALAYASPLKPEKIAGVDFVVVRELTGGLYFGKPQGRFDDAEGGKTRAVDTLEYSDVEIKRIVDLAFRLAAPRRARVTSVDKANVLASSRLWREIATETARAYPNVKLDHLLVDTCAMRLVAAPASFDVIVTENMFGDILTDEAAVLVGSMGLLPSASLGSHALKGVAMGVYEPIHGSAPDIAGKAIANPIGTILSTAMLLRYSLNLGQEADAIERAVERAIGDGCRTADIAREGERVLSTREMADEIMARL